MSEAHYLHSEESLRRELVAASHAVHARGWVANHDGNLSARLADGRLLCTPTAVSKGDVLPEWLIVVAEDGTVTGTRKTFSELALHRAAYAARPDISVVLHAHPPHATAFAVAGTPLPHPFMAEPVVSLGAEIPVVRGAAELEAALGRADVVLLDRHGVLVVGGCFEQALLRLELLEHLARIAIAAAPLGGPRPLPREEVAALAKRGRPASWPAREGAVKAPAPARPPPRAWEPAVPGGRPDLEAVGAEALRRLT